MLRHAQFIREPSHNSAFRTQVVFHDLRSHPLQIGKISVPGLASVTATLNADFAEQNPRRRSERISQASIDSINDEQHQGTEFARAPLPPHRRPRPRRTSRNSDNRDSAPCRTGSPTLFTQEQSWREHIHSAKSWETRILGLPCACVRPPSLPALPSTGVTDPGVCCWVCGRLV